MAERVRSDTNEEEGMSRYSHDYDIVFCVDSDDDEGLDLTGKEIRDAILKRLGGLGDDELLEAVGSPCNTINNES